MSETTALPFDHERRIARLEQIADDTRRSLDKLDRRFDRIDDRFDRINALFDRMNERFDRVDARFGRIDDRTGHMLLWRIGVMVAGFSGMLGMMAHGFHWL